MKKHLFTYVAAVAAAVAPASAVAAPVATTPIQHVVIIYQENHSFDDVMGQFCARNPSRCSAPRIGSVVTMADGTRVTIRRQPDVVPQVNHNPASQALAAANEWDKIRGCAALEKYACVTEVPASSAANLYAAAKTGVIATAMFQSYSHASWLAHIELVAATNDGFLGYNPSGGASGCRSRTTARWQAPTGVESLQPACIPDYSTNPALYPPGWPASAGGAFAPTLVPHVPNILEDRLDPAGLTWREYISSPTSSLGVHGVWNLCNAFASCTYSADRSNVQDSSQLIADAKNGTLPNVAYVLPHGPLGNTSQHNGDSFIAGDNQIGAYLKALSGGPQWISTAVFILYDDCGCFYDVVRPPAGNGPRTPFVLTSPWAAHATTFTIRTSTASLLRFIEATWNLDPLTSLDANANNLMRMFDFTQVPFAAPLPIRSRPVPSASNAFLRAHPPAPDNT